MSGDEDWYDYERCTQNPMDYYDFQLSNSGDCDDYDPSWKTSIEARAFFFRKAVEGEYIKIYVKTEEKNSP